MLETLPNDWRLRVEPLADRCGTKALANALGVTTDTITRARSALPEFRSKTDRLRLMYEGQDA